MPPLVETNIIPAISTCTLASTPPGSMDVIPKSKSADDLMNAKQKLNHCQNQDCPPPTDAKDATGTSNRANGFSQRIPPTKTTECSASSMEQFGSYLFDSFSGQQCGNHPSNEEEKNKLDYIGLEGSESLHKGVDSGAKAVEDDSSSASTVDHFEAADFMPSNWTDAVEYIPPVGLAVVAGGLCLLNPVLFLGGVVTACTAVGAVHAAQSSYETCIEGNLCQIFESDGLEKSNRGDSKESDKNEKQPLESEVSTTVLDDVEDPIAMDNEANSLMTAQHSVESPSMLSQIPCDPSVLETSEQALDWVNYYYPALKFQVVNDLELKGLNALEVFDVFFADNAPFTFEEFQRKRQDKNIKYGKWSSLKDVVQPSLVAAAATITSPKHADSPLYHKNLKERTLNFDAKTNSGLFGPPYATTTKIQRCLSANKRLMVLESKTTLKNIPFCDRFYVLERWLITSQKQDDQYTSFLSVACQVVFSKSCSFETTIVSKSQDTVRDISKKWHNMATTALEKTEQTRKERLNQDIEQDKQNKENNELGHQSLDTDIDMNIEVERLSRVSSRILGENRTIAVTNNSIQSESKDGRPPFAHPGCGKDKEQDKRKSSVRRSLSRSFSGLMKRRQSNPL